MAGNIFLLDPVKFEEILFTVKGSRGLTYVLNRFLLAADFLKNRHHNLYYNFIEILSCSQIKAITVCIKVKIIFPFCFLIFFTN
jgi:hypothetical protein